ncbi:hypothetical protein MCG98_16480 [Ruminococcus sp. OA3]|uniref:hypothetical protein n=1 Tax=Ruminococcus sp. OA3 TaxID=2914164 RepID=UPI001F05B42D|nr:hypothetical protein [Ruminococcus sp. OA3]MCH1984164.1 hypothetical protein [Ruminococcus sp. OA3]
MAYQLKRSKKYIEELQLVDENGNVQHTLQVRLDGDELLRNINGRYLELIKAHKKYGNTVSEKMSHEETDDAIKELGQATVNMIMTVFGPENAKLIVNFYEGRYVELTQEVTPFMIDVVVPRCQEIIKENKERAKARYNRKQRKKLFRRD